MEIDKVAKRLAELGNPSRLAAFRLLVQAGPEGLPVKDIQSHLDIPQSTLSHHIAHLVSAGLISQTREGRILRCRVEYNAIRDVLEFLLRDCCAGIENFDACKN
ncbi:MAG TPA: metalloregulator ArsR/SmtB family transcription factor [Desulfobacteria bacterium]|nr:metalloregulator ArsR/SmtB family transcription factor [Desulfobacteria bacterium]